MTLFDTTSFDRLVAALAAPVFEALGRDDEHFERIALTLPGEADGQVGQRAGEADASARRELVQAIAEAAGVPVREATSVLPVDAVGELMRLELQWACAGGGLLPLPPGDWRGRVQAIVAPLRAAQAARQAPRFDALPGLVHAVAADGRTRYTRCGNGDSAVLLVNAFGLGMDVWHDLALRLSAHGRVLALEADPCAADGGDDPYYGAPDAPARFAGAIQAVLAAEGLAACHVASWCGGSKLALELARRRPEAVSSLVLLAPSFAGEGEGEGNDSGGDSAFETSLATMCQVVDRLPAAAPGMARAMQAMLARGGNGGGAAAGTGGDDPDGSAVFALHDRVTTPWVHAPFESASRMVAYSRRLLAFRAHRVAASEAGRDEAPLAMPLMLVTAELDATTNNRRAATLLAALGTPAHFELRRAGHYFPHQNAALVAPLLLDFFRHGPDSGSTHPRLRRVEAAIQAELVSGEL
jgi:pimeloyl-ACP methyl ester carboxylesterase